MRPDTAEWIDKAENDFRSAHWELKAPQPQNFDLICFLCQQCVEKLMKALLNERGIQFRKTHELAKLSLLVSAAAPGWVFDPNDLGRLQPGAVEFRYPGLMATAQDATDALAACSRLRQSLTPLI
jgi:HEPN domain-containing protein